MRRALLGISIGIALFGSGCIAVGGSGKAVRTYPTLGQELRDLKLARDDGAINDAEFEQARARLLGARSSLGD
jgi:hypothetical protein